MFSQFFFEYFTSKSLWHDSCGEIKTESKNYKDKHKKRENLEKNRLFEKKFLENNFFRCIFSSKPRNNGFPDNDPNGILTEILRVPKSGRESKSPFFI